MLWLFIGIFILLLLCAYLESDSRQAERNLNVLVKKANQKADIHKPTTRPWFG